MGRLNLQSLLEVEPDFQVIAQCPDATTALQAMALMQPQLVFLDIEMPGLNGIDALASGACARPPAVVFVTAHEQFAARAFELEAVDYLLKPFRRERFQRVLDRVRQHLRSASTKSSSAALPDRMVVRSAGRFLFVAFDELDFVRASGNYVVLHAGSEVHEVREPIGAIEQRLPAGRFLRLHRSYIANVAALASLEPAGGGEFVAKLRNGRELPVGPTYVAELKRALGA